MRKLLAGAVLALTLAGCTQIVEPPPPTDAELATYIREQQDLLWFEYGSPQFARPTVESVLVALNSGADDRCIGSQTSMVDPPAQLGAIFRARCAALPDADFLSP